MIRYAALLFLLFSMNEIVLAQSSYQLTTEDRQLINDVTRDYNVCVQQNALQQLDNYNDIRKVAAHAVERCEHQLARFKEYFDSRDNTGFYSGMENNIKNRSIKNLLPLLMYEKSSRQNSNESN